MRRGGEEREKEEGRGERGKHHRQVTKNTHVTVSFYFKTTEATEEQCKSPLGKLNTEDRTSKTQENTSGMKTEKVKTSYLNKLRGNEVIEERSETKW